MDNNLWTGQLTRLTAAIPETHAEMMSRWSGDSEFGQLFDTDPAVPRTVGQVRRDMERWESNPRPGWYGFFIRTLADDRVIGVTMIWNTTAPSRDGWVGIAIGDRNDWSKGYGSDAFNTLLGFGFRELNLFRITLITFGYNPRAIRAYEKVGFQIEGRVREGLLRYGRRWDLVFMGIVREEWERKNKRDA